MKRRQKVWVVVRLKGGYWNMYKFKADATIEAKTWASTTNILRVVPAILEYDVPEKKDGIK